MTTTYVGTLQRPDGYQGRTVVAHLVLDGNDLLEVYVHGWHPYTGVQGEFRPFLPKETGPGIPCA